jgi:HNH endonuclease/NUMOD4 motif
VLGYQSVYEVSNQGRIRRLTPGPRTFPGKVLKPMLRAGGYPFVHLREPGRTRHRRVHILVANAFLGPTPPGKEVNHINGNRCDPRLSNLEYVTRGGNQRHAYLIGLKVAIKGERNPASRLSEGDVKTIRSLGGIMAKRAIARKFGIHPKTVRDILCRKIWKHI